LVILIIPGTTPNMAFAANEGNGSLDTGDLSAGTTDKTTDKTTTDISETSTTYKTKTEKTKTEKTKTEKTKADKTKADKTIDQTTIDKTTTDDSGTSTDQTTIDKTTTDDSGTSTTDNSGTSTTDNSGTTDDLDTGDNVESYISGSSSNSHRSGMGSGVSTEPAKNIAVKELATRNVISGNHVKYEFPKNVTCVTYIDYDAKRTFRKTTAIVEILKGKSTLVPELPAGGIYKYVNIWVGENAAGLPTSLKNGLVGFRVERQWIEKNNVNESLVTLQWYDNKEWQLLDTEKVGEDEDYIYFESNTPGYSFFAITEIEYDAEENEIQLQKNLRNLGGQNSIGKNPMKVAKIFIAVSLPLFVLLVGYATLNKKI
jgi:PGF-pre-PGF domain-containing protein